MPPRWSLVIRDCLIVVVVSAVLALATNVVRSSGGIALVADKDYQILVPCPEHVGKPARALQPHQLKDERQTALLVDARDKEAYIQWHLPGAISIPYDYLEPNPEERKILDTQARRVVVYGDGDSPDSGQQLANAISGKGLKNVFYIKGGAPALRKEGRGP
jgi:rhodanese-related sulfurtransferase